MPKYKNVVTFDPKKDEKYINIMRGLKVHGEYIIDSDNDNINHHMRMFGHHTKPLRKNNLMEDPWIQRDTVNHDIKKRMFRLPEKVIVKEEQKNGKVWFYFSKKRKI